MKILVSAAELCGAPVFFHRCRCSINLNDWWPLFYACAYRCFGWSKLCTSPKWFLGVRSPLQFFSFLGLLYKGLFSRITYCPKVLKSKFHFQCRLSQVCHGLRQKLETLKDERRTNCFKNKLLFSAFHLIHVIIWQTSLKF